MIDTLKLSKGLQEAGMTQGQAEKVAETLQEAQSDYVTKADLKSAFADFQRWIFVALAIQLALMVTIIGIINAVVYTVLSGSFTNILNNALTHLK